MSQPRRLVVLLGASWRGPGTALFEFGCVQLRKAQEIPCTKVDFLTNHMWYALHT